MSEKNDKRQAYITEATFRQITSKIELPEDFQFSDTFIWELTNGTAICVDNPVIFSDREIKDLLTFKAIVKNSNLLNITVLKKVKDWDSYRYLTPEKNPCYHLNIDCEKLHADYCQALLKIPDEYKKRHLEKEEFKTRVNEYRAYFRKLVIEFYENYGEGWMTKNIENSFRIEYP